MINTEEEYNLALKRLDQIFQVKPGDPEEEEFLRLCSEIEEYEDIHFNID